MSLTMLRRVFLQHSRTVYKIKPRHCSADGKTTKIPGTKQEKPPGIFDLYFQDHIEEERASNTYLKQNELIRLVGKKWKSAPEEQKRAYREKFLKGVEEYKQHLIDFEDGLDNRQQIIEALKNVRDQASETEEQTSSKVMDFPSRPTTAFAHFVRAALEAFPRNPNQSTEEWNEQLADKWREMSEPEKQSFRETSRQSSEKFEVEKDDPRSTFSVDEVGGFQR